MPGTTGDSRTAPRRILVVKLAALGDLLTATPALRALRTTFPAAHIGVLTTPGSAAALRGLDSLDEMVLFDKFTFDRPSEALSNVPVGLQLARTLHEGRWDTLVLLHHLTTRFGVAKYAALCLGSGAPRRVGLDNGRRGWSCASRPTTKHFRNATRCPTRCCSGQGRASGARCDGGRPGDSPTWAAPCTNATDSSRWSWAARATMSTYWRARSLRRSVHRRWSFRR